MRVGISELPTQLYLHVDVVYWGLDDRYGIISTVTLAPPRVRSK